MVNEQGPSTSPILEGITVVDLTTFVTGGFASLMLSNLGAEVIKVERPGVGDDSRYSGPPFVQPTRTVEHGQVAAESGESPYFWTVNYDKRSIEVDLKTEEGVDIIYKLINDADVFLENFRPGTAERLGLGPDAVRSTNDQIIYCSISAFGEDGPWHKRPGYDLLVQGMSGIMSITGEENGEPVKVGLPTTDLITAMWAAYGIVGSLYRRERTGEGERVELGMLDATLPWLTKQAGKAFLGETPTAMGTKDPVLAPYQSFPTATGYLNVACGNQKLWEQLCEAIDRPDLAADDRFRTNADRVLNLDELDQELSTVFLKRSTDEWVELLAETHGLPVGPLYTVNEALDNEQVHAREMIDELDHPAIGTIPVINHPLNFEHAETGFTSAPPLLGEDTHAVLLELGYSPENIKAFRERGVIPYHD